jgi:methyl-accepting chemotaxis protein
MVMILLSVFGGYQLSRLIDKINDDYSQRTEKILAMERGLDDATVAFSRRIQEWKDMLLRANDTELYNKHRQAFFIASTTLHEAFQRTRMAMQNDGLDTGLIENMLHDNEMLLSDYLTAKSMLNPRQIDSFREVDQQVIGVDRHLQDDFATLEADIRQFSNQQLNKIMPAYRSRYLIGLLGACSLLIIAIIGFAFASHVQSSKNKKTGS